MPRRHACLQLNGRFLKRLHASHAKAGAGLGACQPQHLSVPSFQASSMPAGRGASCGTSCGSHAQRCYLHQPRICTAQLPGARTAQLLATAEPSCWYEQSTCPCLHLVTQLVQSLPYLPPPGCPKMPALSLAPTCATHGSMFSSSGERCGSERWPSEAPGEGAACQRRHLPAAQTGEVPAAARGGRRAARAARCAAHLAQLVCG